jgi:hypothetical protein
VAHARHVEQYGARTAERMLRHERQKLKFEAKRMLVRRAEKAQQYRTQYVAAMIDRKDQQAAHLKQAKTDLRERRGQQARNFFVQKRRLAELQDKELQNLRFYGRTSNAVGKPAELRQQLNNSRRLHSVRARPRQSRAPRVLHSKSSLSGAFVWASRAHP